MKYSYSINKDLFKYISDRIKEVSKTMSNYKEFEKDFKSLK